MRIAEQLEALRGALADWAQGERGGTAEVASDPFHLFALLAAKPGAVRVCLYFRDEVLRGDHEEAGVYDRTFIAVVSRGRGFTREPSDSLWKGAGGGGPMFELVEDVRDLIRGFEFDSNWSEVRPAVKRAELFPAPDGMVVDAYQIEFSIGVQLDRPEAKDLASGLGNVVAAQ